MKNLDQLVKTFGLVEQVDEVRPRITKLASMIKPGKYTTQQMFDGMAFKFRKNESDQWWFHKANKWLDLLVYYDFIIYKEGYYERTQVQNNCLTRP